MDRQWKQIFAAVLMGFVIPQMILNGMSRLDGTQQVETQPEQTETEPAPTATAVHQQVMAVMYIPVLTDGGSVKIMELEEYIRGVVLAEMPASFEKEALKAQAVAARTYTLRRLTLGDKHSMGVVCTDSNCCQAYLTDEAYLAARGTEADLEKVSGAVTATAGEVLTYEGALIEATYFACSGGRTEDAAAVWGADIPYLQAVDSPGETKAEGYDRELYFSKAKFATLLGRNLEGSPTGWLGDVTYTGGGGVATMVIGGMTYTGTQLRKLLGLNSTLFTMTADSGGITVTTQGWGHRVGMSQYGADAMAVSGSTYDEILAYYYQGTRIDKISELE